MISRIKYYVRRMSESPLRVIFGKITLKLRKKYYFLEYYRKKGKASAAVVISDRRSLARVTEFGLALTKDIKYISDQSPAYVSGALFRAQEVLRNDFACLGYGMGKIPRGKDWMRDQFHDYQWPDCYFDRCDFIAAGRYCDVKVPWEYSRLQYLMWLAEGYILDENGQVHYRGAFEEIVLDWITHNPPGFGVNWACPMEVAIRAVNLSIASSVFANSLPEKSIVKIIETLNEHIKFIERFPEHSDVAGNHFLADLMGAAVVRLILHGTSHDKFEETISHFLDEAIKQFEDDGCHLERAPVYHRLCLDMVAIVAALAVRNGLPQSGGLLSMLDHGLDFCRSVSSVTRKLPVIGDCDSGHILWFGGDERDYSELASFAKAVHGKWDGVCSANGMSLWLAGLANVKIAASLTNKPRQGLILKPEAQERSGFLSARSGNLAAVMRVGHQGLEGRASHDHDDALSLWVFYDDRDIIVDEGCHSYTLEDAIRQRYIRSSAHNVVQQIETDRFIPTEGSVCKSIRGAETCSSWKHAVANNLCLLEAELEASARQGQKFAHCVRALELSQDIVRVRDGWSWRDGSAVAEVRWHFGPDLLPAIEASDRFRLVNKEDGAAVAEVDVAGMGGLRLEAFDYSYSPKYGASQICHGVRIITPPHIKAEIVTAFYFASAKTDIRR